MQQVLEDLDQKPRLKLAVLAVAALVLSMLPVIGSLLGWFETFFHEMSHGLVAIVTGGRIVSIELAWNGAGLIRYAGSWSPFLVTFSGYPGAVLCGVLLYMASSGRKGRSFIIISALAILQAVTALLWMRDVTSLIICAIMIAILFGLWRWAERFYARIALQLIAVFLMVAGIKSIWSILGFEGRGDAKLIADMSWFPAFLFPPIWLGLGLMALFWLWRREERRVRH